MKILMQIGMGMIWISQASCSDCVFHILRVVGAYSKVPK